jgi:quercetin dioxygenase-like cupin family protein
MKAAGPHLVRPNRQEDLEAIYLYSGSLDVQTRDRRFQLKKGDVVVIDARPNLRFIEVATG